MVVKLGDKPKKMPEGAEKQKGKKILKIPEFNLNERKQRGQGLKMLTPNQMLSRLPILIAQLKARNNFEKLRNEFRELLYSLYRSKKLLKISVKV